MSNGNDIIYLPPKVIWFRLRDPDNNSLNDVYLFWASVGSVVPRLKMIVLNRIFYSIWLSAVPSKLEFSAQELVVSFTKF